jgi:hypothetical protein
MVAPNPIPLAVKDLRRSVNRFTTGTTF